MLLEPVIAVGLAAWLLGETLRPVQLAGAAAVLTAGLLVQRSGRGVGLDESQAVAAHETAPDPPSAGSDR